MTTNHPNRLGWCKKKQGWGATSHSFLFGNIGFRSLLSDVSQVGGPNISWTTEIWPPRPNYARNACDLDCERNSDCTPSRLYNDYNLLKQRRRRRRKRQEIVAHYYYPRHSRSCLFVWRPARDSCQSVVVFIAHQHCCGANVKTDGSRKLKVSEAAARLRRHNGKVMRKVGISEVDHITNYAMATFFVVW